MRRALLVIDVQNGYFTGTPPVSYPEGCYANILKTMDIANHYNIPVILVQHTALNNPQALFIRESDAWRIATEVLAKPYQHLVEKHLPGSFSGTNLDDILKKEEIDTVVIAGYMTQMCCDTTARQAFERGYRVEFLSDATGTKDIANYAGAIRAHDLHHAVLLTQAMVFSRVLSLQQWMEGLEG